MADLIDTITNAVQEVGDDAGMDAAETTSADETAAEGGVPESGSADVPADAAPADPNAAPPTHVADDLDKELEAQGIKRVAGERENRIPYSRVKKIVANAQKKLVDAHTASLNETTGKLTKAEERAKAADTVDQLIAGDPDRYIGMLAMLHPDKYKKFVTQGTGSAPAVGTTAAPTTTDAKPEPDYRFEDGSLGYTPDQHERLLEWNARKAKKEALDEVDKKYGSVLGNIQQREIAAKQAAEAAPKIASQLNWAKAKYGKLFEDDYEKANKGQPSEILIYWKANPHLPFEAAVVDVLDPKRMATVQTDRDKMRAELLKELNTRPGAASSTAPTGAKATPESSGPRSMEDVIRDSIAALK